MGVAQRGGHGIGGGCGCREGCGTQEKVWPLCVRERGVALKKRCGHCVCELVLGYKGGVALKKGCDQCVCVREREEGEAV